MKSTIKLQWDCRRGGGIFLGLRAHFPVRIVFDDGEIRPVVDIILGFAVFSILIEVAGRLIDHQVRGCSDAPLPSLQEMYKKHPPSNNSKALVGNGVCFIHSATKNEVPVEKGMK